MFDQYGQCTLNQQIALFTTFLKILITLYFLVTQKYIFSRLKFILILIWILKFLLNIYELGFFKQVVVIFKHSQLKHAHSQKNFMLLRLVYTKYFYLFNHSYITLINKISHKNQISLSLSILKFQLLDRKSFLSNQNKGFSRKTPYFSQ